jgi:hypothetical protein
MPRNQKNIYSQITDPLNVMLRVVSCGISVISFYKFNTKYCLVCINNIIIIKINIKIEIDSPGIKLPLISLK